LVRETCWPRESSTSACHPPACRMTTASHAPAAARTIAAAAILGSTLIKRNSSTMGPREQKATRKIPPVHVEGSAGRLSPAGGARYRSVCRGSPSGLSRFTASSAAAAQEHAGGEHAHGDRAGGGHRDRQFLERNDLRLGAREVDVEDKFAAGRAREPRRA